MDQNHILRPKRYRPDPSLVEYIREELRMKEIRRTRENAGEDLSDEEKRFERNLDKRKSTWMNKIFQVTADLIFFLECIATNPELREEFKDEYNNLFRFGVEDPSYYYAFHVIPGAENTFLRLISSVLQVENRGMHDTSMAATYLAQEAVYEKMRKVLEDNLGEYDLEIASKISSDIRYCLAWIRFVSVPDEQKTHLRREIDSHNPVLSDLDFPQVNK
jgi:hypothetical protein